MPTLDAPHTSEIPTLVGGQSPLTSTRERSRAALTAPRLDPGRYLAIMDGDEVVVIRLADGQMRVGRSTAADVMLEHLSVSRRHAVVAQRGEQTVILDDRSRNGVWVNGERVREAELHHNDEILLGDVAMRFLHVV